MNVERSTPDNPPYIATDVTGALVDERDDLKRRLSESTRLVILAGQMCGAADRRINELEAAIRDYVDACDVLQGEGPPDDAWIEASNRYEDLRELVTDDRCREALLERDRFAEVDDDE